MKRDPWNDTNLILLENEYFKDIPGYLGYYSISNLGRVKSEQREVVALTGTRIVKERIRKQYPRKQNSICKASSMLLSIEGKKCQYTISELMGMTFLRDKSSNERIVHLNKNPYDNRLENLRIMSINKSLNLDYKLKKRVRGRKHAILKNGKIRDNIKLFEENKRKCKKCLKIKDVSLFYDYKNYYKNKDTACIKCRKEIRALYHKKRMEVKS